MKKYLIYIFLIFNLSVNLFAELVSATEFELKDQYQVEHSLEKYKGKKVFMIFWSSWCNYCKEELKDIKELYKDTGENKKDRIFLTFNNEDEKNLEGIIKEREYKFPVINDKVIFYKYFVRAVPTMYLINEDGKVVQSIIGKIERENLEKLIENQNYEITDKKE